MILAEYFEIWIIELNLNGYCLNCSESHSSGPGRTNLYGHQYYQKYQSHPVSHRVQFLDQYFFLIYINDLPEYIKHSRIRLFADDSMIYRQIKSQSDCLKLQEDLEAAIKWEQDWLMVGGDPHILRNRLP